MPPLSPLRMQSGIPGGDVREEQTGSGSFHQTHFAGQASMEGGAQQLSQAAGERDEFAQGVNAAAAMLDKMADDYAAEHSTQDNETGVWEFGRHGEDYYNTLRELADDVRSIVHGNGATTAGGRVK